MTTNCLSLAQMRVRRSLDSVFSNNGTGVHNLPGRLDVYNEGIWARCIKCGEIVRGIENLQDRGYFEGSKFSKGKVESFVCKRCLQYNP